MHYFVVKSQFLFCLHTFICFFSLSLFLMFLIFTCLWLKAFHSFYILLFNGLSSSHHPFFGDLSCDWIVSFCRLYYCCIYIFPFFIHFLLIGTFFNLLYSNVPYSQSFIGFVDWLYSIFWIVRLFSVYC